MSTRNNLNHVDIRSNASDGEPGRSDDFRAALLVLTIGALGWSGAFPYDRLTWLLEVLPILIILPILVKTRRVFRLTPLLYGLLFLHGLVLMVGGRYTYARVPVGNVVRNVFGLARNPYDRFGHLMQGGVPAILAREILIRRSPLRGSRWLGFLVVCVCLAFSALYELFEALSAGIGGSAATDFLGTQGDPWDTQWDMACALFGAIVSLLVLSRWHDRQLAALSHGENPAIVTRS